MSQDDGIDRSLVLVICRSTVNRIVISRIVERMALRVEIATPDDDELAPGAGRAAIVILDGGAGDDDCNHLLADLERLRARESRALPAILLLAASNAASPAPGIVDMVVAKPVTLDRLQPAIEALRARNGDHWRGRD